MPSKPSYGSDNSPMTTLSRERSAGDSRERSVGDSQDRSAETNGDRSAISTGDRSNATGDRFGYVYTGDIYAGFRETYLPSLL